MSWVTWVTWVTENGCGISKIDSAPESGSAVAAMKLARNWQELRETAVFCEQEMAHPERFELSLQPRVAATDHAALFQINGLAQRHGSVRTGVAGKLARNWQAGGPDKSPS